MPIMSVVRQNLPYVRRYARALTGDQKSGDQYVRQLLESALADEVLRLQLADGRVPLYRAFTQIWRSSSFDGENAVRSDGNGEAICVLPRVTSLARQALLLTSLEDFSADEVAEILDTDSNQVGDLVDAAIVELETQPASEIMIIEDEPLISMQLEQIVETVGHRVCGTAATRTMARQVFAETSPDLILADIQLADGSSGIDAVSDILSATTVPVIFITAYPERLLTGERPEPTFLISKPFQDSTVRAAIGQALFFGSGA